jgi:hypothetical protein
MKQALAPKLIDENGPTGQRDVTEPDYWSVLPEIGANIIPLSTLSVSDSVEKLQQWARCRCMMRSLLDSDRIHGVCERAKSRFCPFLRHALPVSGGSALAHDPAHSATPRPAQLLPPHDASIRSDARLK